MDTAQTDQELFEKELNTSRLDIDELVGGDKEMPIFLSEWLKNGLNASAAYKTLHLFWLDMILVIVIISWVLKKV